MSSPPPMPTNSSKPMLHNIQFLRGLAALIVVAVHLKYPWCAGKVTGHFGVDIFFVISGFIMSHICTYSPSHFLLRRVIRVVPFYWAATIGVFVIALLAPDFLRSTKFNLGNLAKSLLFIPYQKENGLVQPMFSLGWTLNYEMYFYLLTAFGLKIWAKGATVVAVTAMALIQVCIKVSGCQSAVCSFYSDTIIYEFAFGVLIFQVITRLPKPASPRNTWLWGLLSVTALLSGIVAERLMPDLNGRFVFLGLPAMVLVTGAIFLEGSAMTHRVRRWEIFGDSSYMLYLSHPFVLDALRHSFARVVIHEPHPYLAPAVMIVALIVWIAILLHKYVELPVIKILKKLIPR